MIAERVLMVQLGWRKQRERLVMWIAWHVPKWLAYWCFIRVAAHATTGEWSGSVPHNVSIMDALERWDGRRF